MVKVGTFSEIAIPCTKLLSRPKTAENDRFCRVRNAVLKSQAIFPQAHWSKCSSICDTPCGSKESPVYREICTGGGWGKTPKTILRNHKTPALLTGPEGGISVVNLVFHRTYGRGMVLTSMPCLGFNSIGRVRAGLCPNASPLFLKFIGTQLAPYL